MVVLTTAAKMDGRSVLMSDDECRSWRASMLKSLCCVVPTQLDGETYSVR